MDSLNIIIKNNDSINYILYFKGDKYNSYEKNFFNFNFYNKDTLTKLTAQSGGFNIPDELTENDTIHNTCNFENIIFIPSHQAIKLKRPLIDKNNHQNWLFYPILKPNHQYKIQFETIFKQ